MSGNIFPFIQVYHTFKCCQGNIFPFYLTLPVSCGRLTLMKKGLGSIIRARRKELKMTCKGLAEQAGVDRSYVGKIENLNLLPAYHILVKLEAILGISLTNLYLERKKIAPDFLVANPEGGYTAIEAKQTPSPSTVFGEKGYGKSYLLGQEGVVLFHFLDDSVAGTKKKESPQNLALIFIQKFIPSKVEDRQLRNDLATTIRTLRRTYPALVSQSDKNVL